ncbi:MAG: hypothetical protein KC417_09220, partial [Myxococcales bacterium]|nr:hypothetical protein [Myxococcales bacterium]
MGTGPAPEEARPSTAPTNIARTDAHAWRWRVGVVAFAFVFHLTSLGFGFLEWDDPLHVSRNNLVVAPQTRTWTEHLTTPALGYPIPVTVLTYRAEAAAF